MQQKRILTLVIMNYWRNIKIQLRIWINYEVSTDSLISYITAYDYSTINKPLRLKSIVLGWLDGADDQINELK